VHSITSIQFKRANFFTNGYIQFAFKGGREAKARIFEATKDENTVMFRAGEQQRRFEALKTEIEAAIKHSTKTQSGFSVAEEIGRLAKLRDEGILTPTEFEAQKTKLLV
jgi:hypothetical protein